MALLVLFWSVSLFYGSWGLRASWLGSLQAHMSLISKVFALVFPAILMSLRTSNAILDIPALFFIVTNFVSKYSSKMFMTASTNSIQVILSFTVGTVVQILTLYKYMKTRRLLAGQARRGRWWAPGSIERSNIDIGTDTTTSRGSHVLASAEQAVYDRALVIRFSIGFFFLA
jgi:hypothetical protein